MYLHRGLGFELSRGHLLAVCTLGQVTYLSVPEVPHLLGLLHKRLSRDTVL